MFYKFFFKFWKKVQENLRVMLSKIVGVFEKICRILEQVTKAFWETVGKFCRIFRPDYLRKVKKEQLEKQKKN